ncbi:putative Mannosylglycerate hydrolase [Oenococcus oeni]|uniref:glycoside hydrolase family 38 N-terminal domain-containing protein n=1 Tax=Oenococcus oeni TaxID=1247 RepID=UPI0010790949|nr:glycoside hydrolase family 38 C-terminal domain-containing protein [Oenococcus oeni]AVI94653.1 alpha-mannosidase [Oenococcus oeni]SYV98966.1 putative Mannosylglycerate hydrolase [Oenococcus oeni]SYV99332.1 putative Mannosylglycerate hydrolase [Oenococcus oeni]SYW18158.1 putative Mannosylglycerate hydrolase [Oenococcus oeni]VDC15251.1 putative Mannosylglycerate hydrolase [Oenococcus oeni]
MVKAYLVNHTHWDREWYFTTEDALVLSEQLFTEVLDELQKDKAANFCLDGQSSIVDEYVEIHPEKLTCIKELVAEGRLFIGPWYTQTDGLLPDAESIIRNLVIGINDTKKYYGEPMMVGYLPDTFGFNAQLPTLLNQVGIDSFIFWRGTDYDKQLKSLYFRWRGLSDKQVIAVNFPFGYFTAQITPESKQKMNQFVEERFDKAVDFAETHGDNRDVLMPSGIDQMNIVKNIDKTVQELNKLSRHDISISSYPDFISILREKKDLPVYKGELRTPKYARVHRTIGSVRHEIKRKNFQLEQKVLKRVEPLTVIAHKVGLDIGNGLLIHLWKKLLQCQAHDTLGGSVTDDVAVDIFHRFKEGNEIADGIENMVKKKLAEYLHLDNNQVLLFNTLPYDEVSVDRTIKVLVPSKNIRIEGMRDAVIENSKYFPERHHILMMTPRGREFTDEPEYFELSIRGKVDMPALGYKVFNIKKTDVALPEISYSKASSSASITSGEQTLEFSKGAISLKNSLGEFHNILELVDSANDGDTYDYSPLAGDTEQSLPFQKAVCAVGDKDHPSLIIYGSASLPKELSDRKSSDPKYGELKYELQIEFDENGILNSHLAIDNDVLSHRLRLKFNPEIKSNKIIAGIQAGYTESANQAIPNDWEKHFDEKPVNIFDFDKTLTLSDGQSHFTFWGAGQKEYEHRDDSLYVTLMATTSQLGKANLAWRPGRASGDTTNQGHVMIPTPLAEELGKNKFDFAFELKAESFDMTRTNQLTQRWLNPSISYQKQSLNLFINRLDNKIWETEENPVIPKELSLLKLDPKLNVSAIYPAYSDEKTYLVRIQNMTNLSQPVPNDFLKKALSVNALEKPIAQKPTIDPFDLASFKIRY